MGSEVPCGEGVECASFAFMLDWMLFRFCSMSWTEVCLVPLLVHKLMMGEESVLCCMFSMMAWTVISSSWCRCATPASLMCVLIVRCWAIYSPPDMFMVRVVAIASWRSGECSVADPDLKTFVIWWISRWGCVSAVISRRDSNVFERLLSIASRSSL